MKRVILTILILMLSASSAISHDTEYCKGDNLTPYGCDMDGSYSEEGIYKCFCGTNLSVCNIDNQCKNRQPSEAFIALYDGKCHNYTCSSNCTPVRLDYLKGCDNDLDCDGVDLEHDLCTINDTNICIDGDASQSGMIVDDYGCTCTQKKSEHCLESVRERVQELGLEVDASDVCCEKDCHYKMIGLDHMNLRYDPVCVDFSDELASPGWHERVLVISIEGCHEINSIGLKIRYDASRLKPIPAEGDELPSGLPNVPIRFLLDNSTSWDMIGATANLNNMTLGLISALGTQVCNEFMNIPVMVSDHQYTPELGWKELVPSSEAEIQLEVKDSGTNSDNAGPETEYECRKHSDCPEGYRCDIYLAGDGRKGICRIPVNPYYEFCNDTDGGNNPDESGVVIYKGKEGQIKNTSDICFYGQVMEAVCDFNGYAYNSLFHSCQEGCEDGTCKTGCRDDGDCKINQLCNEGTCEEISGCIEDSDCRDDKICISRECTEKEIVSCIDHDGKDNFENGSYVAIRYNDGTESRVDDSCSGDYAIDYWCHGNKLMNSTEGCSCQLGRCSQGNAISCEDHDSRRDFDTSSYVELTYGQEPRSFAHRLRSFLSRLFNTAKTEKIYDKCIVEEGKTYNIDYGCSGSSLQEYKRECDCRNGACHLIWRCEDKGDHVELTYNDRSNQAVHDYLFRGKTVDMRCDKRDYYSVYEDIVDHSSAFAWQDYFREAVDKAVESEDIWIYAETGACNAAEAYANIYRDYAFYMNTSLNYLFNETIARKHVDLENEGRYFNEFRYEIICNGVHLGESSILKVFPENSTNIYARCHQKDHCMYDHDSDLCLKEDKRCDWLNQGVTPVELSQWDVIFARYMQGKGELDKHEFRFDLKTGDRYIPTNMSEIQLRDYLNISGYPISDFEEKFNRTAPKKGMGLVYSYLEMDAFTVWDEEECSCIPEYGCEAGETKCSGGHKKYCREFANGNFWWTDKNCGVDYIDGAYFPRCVEKDGEAYCANANDQGYHFCVEPKDYETQGDKMVQTESGNCSDIYGESRTGDYTRKRTYDGCSWSAWEYTDYGCECNEDAFYQEYHTPFGTICRSTEMPECEDEDQYLAMSTPFGNRCKDKPSCGCDADEVCVELAEVPDECDQGEKINYITPFGSLCSPASATYPECYHPDDCSSAERCMMHYRDAPGYHGTCTTETHECVQGCYNDADCNEGHQCVKESTQYNRDGYQQIVGRCESTHDIVKIGVDRPVDKVLYAGEGDLIHGCVLKKDLQGNYYIVYAEAYCAGDYWLDPLLSKNTGNCSTGYDYNKIIKDENGTYCSMDYLMPDKVEIGIGNSDKVQEHYEGFNDVVEFCGIRKGLPMHGNATCHGNWTLDPLDWSSTCDGDGVDPKEDWIADYADYYFEPECADNVGVPISENLIDDPNLAGKEYSGTGNIVEFCGIFNGIYKRVRFACAGDWKVVPEKGEMTCDQDNKGADKDWIMISDVKDNSCQDKFRSDVTTYYGTEEFSDGPLSGYNNHVEVCFDSKSAYIEDNVYFNATCKKDWRFEYGKRPSCTSGWIGKVVSKHDNKQCINPANSSEHCYLIDTMFGLINRCKR